MSIKSMAMLLESRTFLFDCFTLARHGMRKRTLASSEKKETNRFSVFAFSLAILILQ